MNPETLRQQVAAFPFWYHKIELPGGIVTPGWAPISVPSYGVPENLTGKRVLDVGAWDGFWTFEALKRGATDFVLKTRLSRLSPADSVEALLYGREAVVD